MRIHVQFIVTAGLLTMATSSAAQADDADNVKVRKSVVKILATVRHPDVFRPWTKSSPQEITGSGLVIAGKRILTNAHMVNYASRVFVQPDKSSDKLSAIVEAIAPGIDLAVLKLEDDSFFDNHSPLPINPKLPALQQTVFAYGYPEGGMELSITRGIVSRVEYADYYMMTEGLRIQVDAAINPGNSGGPAVVDGQDGHGETAHTGQGGLAEPDHPALAGDQRVREHDDPVADALCDQSQPEPMDEERQQTHCREADGWGPPAQGLAAGHTSRRARA